MSKQLLVYEGTTEPLEDTLVNEQGAQIQLDGSYLMEFFVVRDRTVVFFKSSLSASQINFDVPAHGHYQIFRNREDTQGHAGDFVYVLTVRKNSNIFHVEQGSFIIKGVDEA